METKTDIEVMNKIIEITEGFRNLIPCSDSFTANINNVRFVDFILLFHRMQLRGWDVRLEFVGGVLNDKAMIIYYKPTSFCTIFIESEKCEKLKPKINLINYN